MINPEQRYQEFKGWIPPEDVDGIDSPKDYLRDVINADFNNGFISNAPAPVLVPLTLGIQTLITAGWELLHTKYFRHHTQKNTYLSILYKNDNGHKLKFFVNGSEISLDNTYTYDKKPTNITFGLANNQLKINTNITATYNTDKTVIFNLTLCYLSAVSYIPATIYTRAAGWYLIPRWLGFKFPEGSTDIILDPLTSRPETTFLEDCQDATFADHFSVTNFQFVNATGSIVESLLGWTKYIGFDNQDNAAGKWGWIIIDDIEAFTRLKFTFLYAFGGKDNKMHMKVGTTDNDVTGTSPEKSASWTEYWNTLYGYDGRLVTEDFDLSMNIMTNDTELDTKDTVTESKTKKLWIGIGLPGNAWTDGWVPAIMIKNIKLEAFNLLLIAKNFDGQRALIKKDFKHPIFDRLVIKINRDMLDWRVTDYELYGKSENIYHYWQHAEIKGAEWVLQEDINFLWRTFEVVNDYPYIVTTLNFNYGLGEVRVDHQELITSEAFYRNRSYFVNGDEKLHYSHISGTGRPQPDSFPYDEELLFGFYTTAYDAINRALAVTQLEEIVIMTDKGDWVYTIEGTSGTPLRRIKAINGGAGILSPNSLLVDFSGNPLAKVLLWFDRWAVYAYAGGRSVPTQVTGTSHKNYWLQLEGKSDAIGFYNKARNEYWIQIDGKILIFEIDTGTWKKYVLDFAIKDIIGIIDDYTYILTTDNKIYKLDPLATTYMQATIEFHDDSCMVISERGYAKPAAEIQDKILQPMFMHFKDTSEALMSITIIADDNVIDVPIIVTTAFTRQPSQSPLLVVFGKIRFKLVIEPTSAKLKEFGFEYSLLDTASAGQTALIATNLRGVGQEAGGEFGVVF